MRWYQSLYWRIAIGVVGCLALLLVVQAILFVWLLGRAGGAPWQPPERFAQSIAVEVAQALERDPALDVEKYVRQEFGRDAQPFFIVLTDGRLLEFGGPFPRDVQEEARQRLAMMRRRPSTPLRGQPPPFGPGFPGGRGGPNEFPRPFDPAQGRPFEGPQGRGGFRPMRGGAIIVNNELRGLVVATPQPPFRFLLARYAPTLAVVAVATLVSGTLLATVLIFGPARRRLRAVETAARKLGGGDLRARAPEEGRDEVAAVAAAFNAMAADLGARADALAAADRTRRQLLADVSHELTTPVTAMRGYLETLTMPGFAIDEQTRTRYLSIVSDETSRLERLIKDLLDLARLDEGGAAFTRGDVPVSQLFGRVAARHEREAAAAGVTFQSIVEPGAEVVRGDAGRLEQAIQNLAANALRYAPSGSAIELRARPVNERVSIEVTDHGPGIPAEHLPRIFDRFYKAEESRTAHQNARGASGSGLGLSIVKAIAERHGARVTVRSEPGQTTFEIEGL